MSKPAHWPSDLQYISKPIYHRSIPKEAKAFLQSCAMGGAKKEAAAPCKVVIRKITDAAHPAFGQCGLFAGQKIPQKTFIIDYIGA